MELTDIINLPDYADEINRASLRFCGIGPRMLDPPGRIWPRDRINPRKQTEMVLYLELARLIERPHLPRVKQVLYELFVSFQACNISNLYHTHIVKWHRHKQMTTVAETLDAYSEYRHILAFLHGILRSVKLPSIAMKADPMIKLFGCSKNVTIYKEHLKWLVIGNAKMKLMLAGKFICFKHMVMDLSKVVWLNGLSEPVKHRVFIQLVRRITWFLTQTLRRYFYITISGPFGLKLFYYRYDLWMRLQSFIIKTHIGSDLLQEVRIGEDGPPPGCQTSRIRFHLKSNNVRLICTEPKVLNERQYQVKAAIEYIVRNMPNHEHVKAPRDLFECLTEMKRRSPVEGRGTSPSVFVVRTDFEDCFQSLNQEKLRSIISEFLWRNFPSGTLPFQKMSITLKNGRIRHIDRWFMNPDINKLKERHEHVEVVRNVKLDLKLFEEKFLNPLVLRPILRESSRSELGYKLMRGIRQGSRTSPSLCDIYIREAFNQNLADLLASDDCKFIFHVDDILLMTTDQTKAERFLGTIIAGLGNFNLKSNPDKLEVNFTSALHRARPPLKEYIMFFRRKIDLKTLGCSYGFSTNEISLDNFFAIDPYSDEPELERTARHMARIEPTLLDFDLNGVKLVVRNIFETALYTAYRLAAKLLLSFVLRNAQTQRPKFLGSLVALVAKRLYLSLESARWTRHVVNSLNYSEFKLIVLAAFRVTWTTKKLRHRREEQDYFEKTFERLMFRYIVFHDDQSDSSETRGIPFEMMVRDLIRAFPGSDFKKKVLLPDCQ